MKINKMILFNYKFNLKGRPKLTISVHNALTKTVQKKNNVKSVVWNLRKEQFVPILSISTTNICNIYRIMLNCLSNKNRIKIK